MHCKFILRLNWIPEANLLKYLMDRQSVFELLLNDLIFKWHLFGAPHIEKCLWYSIKFIHRARIRTQIYVHARLNIFHVFKYHLSRCFRIEHPLTFVKIKTSQFFEKLTKKYLSFIQPRLRILNFDGLLLYLTWILASVTSCSNLSKSWRFGSIWVILQRVIIPGGNVWWIWFLLINYFLHFVRV